MLISAAMQNDDFLCFIGGGGWKKSAGGVWLDLDNKPATKEDFISMLEEFNDAELER